MAVYGYIDVLEELLELAASYRGSGKSWSRNPKGDTSNPVKPLKSPRPTIVPHSEPRRELTAREAVALGYCLQAQIGASHPEAGLRFSRVFSHQDGRALMLEKGVLRDLAAVGAIACDDSGNPDHFILTGLGARELDACLPNEFFS